MTVTVRLASPLANDAGGQRLLQVEGLTVADVVEALRESYPVLARRIVDEQGQLRRHVNVYVGTEECRRLYGLATPTPADCEIYVVGSIAGG